MTFQQGNEPAGTPKPVVGNGASKPSEAAKQPIPATKPVASGGATSSTGTPTPATPTPATPEFEPHEAFPAATKTGAAWAAIIAILVLLILLIIFILDNQGRVYVYFLGWTGGLPMGIALLIAAVAGGVMVAIGGAARILQLRGQQRRVAKIMKAKAKGAGPKGA